VTLCSFIPSLWRSSSTVPLQCRSWLKKFRYSASSIYILAEEVQVQCLFNLDRGWGRSGTVPLQFRPRPIHSVLSPVLHLLINNRIVQRYVIGDTGSIVKRAINAETLTIGLCLAPRMQQLQHYVQSACRPAFHLPAVSLWHKPHETTSNTNMNVAIFWNIVSCSR
jgi:hypothetical protein